MTDAFSGRNPYLRTYSNTFGNVDEMVILRSFELTARRFRSKLLRLVDDLAAGRIDVKAFTTSSSRLLRTEFGIAYALGALSISPFHTLAVRDIRVIDGELQEERAFLRSFAKDLDRGFVVLDPVQRAGLYLQALRGMFELGRIEALPAGPYDWNLSDTEHCLECIEVSGGGPYQKTPTSGLGIPPLPGIPGSGDVCRGLTRCGCYITLSGIPTPHVNLEREIRNVLAEVLHDTS